MISIKHTQDFRLAQPVEIVFPLFSAEGEKLWVPDWEYENIMGSAELHEDYIFLTKHHDHAAADAIWLVKRYEPDTYLVQFYKVEPKDKVGIITVQCTKEAACLTHVAVTYEYIGLSEQGDQFITAFTATEYAAFIDEWNKLLVSYFETLCSKQEKNYVKL